MTLPSTHGNCECVNLSRHLSSTFMGRSSHRNKQLSYLHSLSWRRVAKAASSWTSHWRQTETNQQNIIQMNQNHRWISTESHIQGIKKRFKNCRDKIGFKSKPQMWPICSKPVISRIFDLLSMMHHLKEKEILFTMKRKLSFYLNPNWNYE